MSGPKGVQNICSISDTLKKYTNIDINCSLHYHIGNISTERSNIVVLYMLGYKIQDQLFEMFPYYKTDHRDIKKHNYCMKFKKLEMYPLKDFSQEGYKSYIDQLYVRIFTYFSDGHVPDANNNRLLDRHPVGAKWQQKNRKSWMNLCNLLFSPRRTVEFRTSPPTTNKIKAIAWFYICVAIVKYAEHNVEKILSIEGNIDLLEILNYYKDNFPKNKNAAFLSEYLIEYYQSQRAVFQKDFVLNDYVSQHDIKNDKTFKFNYKGVTLFGSQEEMKEVEKPKMKKVEKKIEIVSDERFLNNLFENVQFAGESSNFPF